MHGARHHLLSWTWKLALTAGIGAGVALYVHQSNYVEPSPPLSAEQAAGEQVSPDQAKDPSAPQVTMDKAQRQYLWEIEHHGLLLSRHGFSRLADALRQPDGAALTALLAADFTGGLPRQPNELRLANAFVEAVRREDSGDLAPLTAEQFRDSLLEYRRLFDQPPQVQLALMTLSPVERGNGDGAWQGTCLLRLWGEAASGEPAEAVLHLRYEVARPAEETFRRGGWLRSCAITQSQIARAPHFLLREAAAERGLDPHRFHDNWKHGFQGTATGGVYVCDYDRDGWLDLLVVDLNCCVLYKGQPGGKFAEVTLQVGLPGRLPNPSGANLAAAFADLDGDGWEDLILNKQLYRNEAGKRFRNVTYLSNLHFQGNVSGIAVADYDRDGRLDLYVTRLTPSKSSSWLDGKGGGDGGNLLFHNLGGWKFEEVAEAAGVTGGDRSAFSAVWFDADNDGWPDLYVPNEFGNGVLYHNQGDGTFQARALVDRPCDFGSMGVTAGDIDNDGHIDLYVANMYSKAGQRVIGNVAPQTYPEEIMATMRSFVAGSQLHRNRGGLRFEQLGQKLQVAGIGWAYGPALVDLDNDGWLDIYATAGFVSQDRDKPDG